jgi:hypothetical protein
MAHATAIKSSRWPATLSTSANPGKIYLGNKCKLAIGAWLTLPLPFVECAFVRSIAAQPIHGELAYAYPSSATVEHPFVRLAEPNKHLE